LKQALRYDGKLEMAMTDMRYGDRRARARDAHGKSGRMSHTWTPSTLISSAGTAA